MKTLSAEGVKFATSADGSRIAYEITGSGPVVVCIFGAICHRNFMPVRKDVKILSRHFRVVNYDRRGRGDSTEASPWSLDRELEDIEALVAANGGKAVLYGHSSGAVLALEATLKLGPMIEGAVVYDASYVSDEADRTEFLSLENRVRRLLDEKKPGKALKTFLGGIGMPKGFVALLPLFPGWGHMKRLAHTLIYDTSLTHDFAPVDRFRAIRNRVLVLAGGKNPPSIRRVYDQLRQAIPECGYDLLPDHDHMVSMEVLVPYFRRLIASPSGS